VIVEAELVIPSIPLAFLAAETLVFAQPVFVKSLLAAPAMRLDPMFPTKRPDVAGFVPGMKLKAAAPRLESTQRPDSFW